jgi:predicted nicotinamide N-methyase
MWAASVVLAHWLVELRGKLNGKRVVELGAGCGLPGIAVHKHSPDALVTITDLVSQSYQNLVYNVDTAKATGGEAKGMWECVCMYISF